MLKRKVSFESLKKEAMDDLWNTNIVAPYQIMENILKNYGMANSAQFIEAGKTYLDNALGFLKKLDELSDTFLKDDVFKEYVLESESDIEKDINYLRQQCERLLLNESAAAFNQFLQDNFKFDGSFFHRDLDDKFASIDAMYQALCQPPARSPGMFKVVAEDDLSKFISVVNNFLSDLDSIVSLEAQPFIDNYQYQIQSFAQELRQHADPEMVEGSVLNSLDRLAKLRSTSEFEDAPFPASPN